MLLGHLTEIANIGMLDAPSSLLPPCISSRFKFNLTSFLPLSLDECVWSHGCFYNDDSQRIDMIPSAQEQCLVFNHRLTYHLRSNKSMASSSHPSSVFSICDKVIFIFIGSQVNRSCILFYFFSLSLLSSMSSTISLLLIAVLSFPLPMP